MSIRVIGCLLFVIGFSWYAYRNWFVSLCATVVLMAFVKHPDMPRGMLGIPGMNFFNLLLANVVIAWRIQRRQEGLTLEFPRSLKIALVLYFSVMIIAFIRLIIDPTGYCRFSRSELFVEYFLNSLRFLVPALLLYDGCRTGERVKFALGTIGLLYFLLAIQVIRYMGLHPDFTGAELSGRASRIVQHSIGYDRVDMSMMLAGASWGMIAFSVLIEKKWLKWAVRGSALLIMFGQALTGGRAGYITWGAVGLILCIMRWRRLLPLIPVAVVFVVMLVPSVAQRMLAGFGGQSDIIVVQQDNSEITSGRNIVWPVVIAQIEKAPLFGYGRLGMLRTGLVDYVRNKLEDSFPHPHEAYFEMMLDSGIIGLACVLPIFLIVLKRSGALFLDRTEVFYEAAGGMALALVLALLIASFGAQTLYPREGVVGMWAAIGVAMRLSVERQRKHDQGEEAPREDVGNEDEVEETSVAGFANTSSC